MNSGTVNFLRYTCNLEIHGREKFSTLKTYHKKHKLIEIYGAFLVDLLAIAGSYVCAYLLRHILPFGNSVANAGEWFPVYILCILGCVMYNLAMNRYDNLFQRGFFEEAIEVLKYNVFEFVTVSACIYVFRLEKDFSRLFFAYYLVLNVILGYLMRCLFKIEIRKNYHKGRGCDQVLIVTDSKNIDMILDKVQSDTAWNYEVAGVVLVDQDCKGNIIHEYKVVANKADLVDIARQMPLDLVFFHTPDLHNEVEEWIQAFLTMGVRCYNCVQRFHFETPYCGIGEFAQLPALYYSINEIDYRRAIIKRTMDIVGGFVGLVITGIVTPFVALAIKIEDPAGPVFFSQYRIGRNGRRFKLYKFRSMYKDAEERKKSLIAQNEVQGPMFKIENDPRITRVGRFIRKTSIDELPQFWNIFKGDMSLVGTRPPTIDEFEQYNDYYRRRLSITPGLTGMWQVSGRSDIKDFDEVVKLDLQYIDNWGLRKDIKILLMTIWVVLFGKGSK